MGWACAGLATALLLLELGLRLTGLAFNILHAVPRPDADGKYVVLCAGDSFVQGVGGVPFPTQLEEMLNARAGRKLFTVINAGQSGTNSEQMILALPKQLKEYRPQALIVLTGMSNWWNTLDTPLYNGGSWATRLDRLLMRSAVYRCSKMALRGTARPVKVIPPAADIKEIRRGRAAEPLSRTKGLPDVFNQAVIAERLGMHDKSAAMIASIPEKTLLALPVARDEARDLLNICYHIGSSALYEKVSARLVSRFPEMKPAATRDLAEFALSEGKLERARGYYGQLASVQGYEHQALFGTGKSYFMGGDPTAAVPYIRKALEAAPAPPDPAREQMLFETLIWLDRLHRTDLVKALDGAPGVGSFPAYSFYLKNAAKIAAPDNPLERHFTQVLSGNLVHAYDLAQARNIIFITTSYPEAEYEGMRLAARQRPGMTFIKLNELFPKRFKNRNEYIAYDNTHCNTAGYRYMAEVLADAIWQKLNLPPVAGTR